MYFTRATKTLRSILHKHIILALMKFAKPSVMSPSKPRMSYEPIWILSMLKEKKVYKKVRLRQTLFWHLITSLIVTKKGKMAVTEEEAEVAEDVVVRMIKDGNQIPLSSRIKRELISTFTSVKNML